jgi:hypothetical protein
MSARTPEDARQDVTVIRLVPLGRANGRGPESAIVTSFGRASMRTEDDAVFLVVGNELTRGRLKVGDIVQWAAEPFGVVWLAEQGVDDARAGGSR